MKTKLTSLRREISYTNSIICLLFIFLFTTKSFCQTNITWQQTNGPFVASVNSLTNGPNGSIYAGTQSQGVFKSTDQGNTWEHLSPSYPIIKCLYIDSTGKVFVGSVLDGIFCYEDTNNVWNFRSQSLEGNSINVIVADTSGNLIAGSQSNGIFMSSDDGFSWQNIDIGYDDNIIRTISIDSQNRVFVGTSSSVYFSTDQENWEKTNLEGYVHSIAINSKNHIFAATENGVFQSVDNGKNWNKLLNIIGRTITIKNDSTILVGSNYSGIFRYDINTDSFSNISQGITYDEHVNDIIVISENSLITATRGGIYISNDNGNNWIQSNNNLSANNSSNVIVKSLLTTSDNEIIVSTLFGGVHKSNSAGDSWIPFNYGLPNNIAVERFVVNSKQQILAATFGGLFKLNLENSIWYTSNLNSFIYSLASNANGYLVAGTSEGLYLSKDDGETWTKTNLNNTILTLTISSSNVVWVSTGNDIQHSIDEGQNWIQTNFSSFNVTDLKVDEKNNIYVSSWEGVFRSEDNGINWELILELSEASSINIDNNGNVYACSRGKGIYYSSNKGDTWVEINSGLKNLLTNTITFDSTGYIYCGIVSSEPHVGSGGGIYKSTLPIITDIEYNDQVINEYPQKLLIQNYPNPFNAQTNIEFKIPFDGVVNLKIYNLQGEEVSQIIINEFLDAGKYKYNWNAIKVSSGICYCQVSIHDLNNNFHTNVIKLNLVK